MMMKFFEEAAALCYGSMMLTTNMNKSGTGSSFHAFRRVNHQTRRAPRGEILIHNSQSRHA